MRTNPLPRQGEGNNVVPLRSDTIWLVQNGCSFHGLWSEDPNKHLKDFLKLVDSLDLNVCDINRTDGKLLDKNADESWEIIENLALYDHEGWNDSKDLVKPLKAISTSLNTSKTPDRRLLELEDQINFLLKGPRPAPRASSTHVPQAYAEAARVQDYMAAHTERMERFENTIFKQREEINDMMIEMFELLKELTTSITLENVLIREEARNLVTKNVNSISLIKGEEEKSVKDNAMSGDSIENLDGSDAVVPLKEVKKEYEAGNRTKNEPVKSAEKKLTLIKEDESVEVIFDEKKPRSLRKFQEDDS
nr:MAK10-like protein [Tanacetum cinerariifolium]